MDRKELEWEDAIQLLDETIELYAELIGNKGVNPFFGLAHLHRLKVRYAEGERSEELYQEMMKSG